jgi:hypothetical protein
MAINSIPPSHTHNVPTPRALEVSKGKAAESPAFVARAQAETSEAPFGRLVSEIAKTKTKTQTDEA